MKFNNEIELFIKDFVKDLSEGTASIFAGAGLSVPAGFVNWSELMEDIALDLGLTIDNEKDLISLAQFHVNEHRTRSKIIRKILDEFIEESELSENHRIISRLPISSIWTTNYDHLIESAFRDEDKIADVKYTNKQLLTNRPKRDVIIYKMHGDANHPTDAILTREQYEQYYQTHDSFINALTGELITKTFLFIGFSFNDPNLNYVLSRLNYKFREEKRQHYCFVKRHKLGDYLNPDESTLDYNLKKQHLIINDLKRYGIKSLMIEDYNAITLVLEDIEASYKKKTIFISGSAETYEPFDINEAQYFIHLLSKKIIENDFRIINGFGWGVGTFVINGALESIYSKPFKHSETQLILKPFPQTGSGKIKLPDLWEEYRQKIISLSGISLFLFGNKKVDEKIAEANGVIREFEISVSKGNICIPIGCTGYASSKIYDLIIENPDNYYEDPSIILPFIKKLANEESLHNKIDVIIKLLNLITN